MKIKINNDFLNLLNKHSFSIFLLQRVVMLHICKRNFLRNNVFIKFFFEFILVIFISILFDNYFSYIEKSFKYISSKSQKDNYNNNNKILKEEIILFKNIDFYNSIKYNIKEKNKLIFINIFIKIQPTFH